MNKNKKNILFYSSVKTKKMFAIQSYYRNDIRILRDLGYNVKLSNSIKDFIFFWKYDIAFLYFYRYSLFSAFFAKLFRKRVYFTGGIDYLEKSFASSKQRFMQALGFKICNLMSDQSIIVSSADLRNIASLYNGRIPKNCYLSFHVVEYEKYKYSGTFNDKDNIIVTIGWMVNIDNVFRKGIDKAILVFSEFVKERSNYKMIIAGPPGEGSNYILQLIRDLNMEKHITYVGTISEEEKISLLKKSKIYMQLSIYEGFGIAAIEALAAGNNVIHSGNGGLKDALSEYGYKVDINNNKEIDNTLTNLCTNEINKSFLQKGIEYVSENFAYSRRYSDFEKIIGRGD